MLHEYATLETAATAELYTEMRVWAEALFQSVHEQFSVPLYGGEYTRRGSNLDLAKIPLNNSAVTVHRSSPLSRAPSAASSHPTRAAWDGLDLVLMPIACRLMLALRCCA